MTFIKISQDDNIATLTLNRGRVNAINLEMVGNIRPGFENLENDSSVRAVILTGRDKFFSFGFDVPELLEYSREELADFLTEFTDLYSYLYLYPKPLIAALNGHAVAGGCMLALPADFRIMAPGKARIGLNEVNIGASVFAGSVEMLTALVGGRCAHEILMGGALYDAEAALRLGLIDRVSSGDGVMQDARALAAEFAGKNAAAFTSIKTLIRRPAAAAMREREKKSIEEFIEIWFSEENRKSLRDVKIRS